MAVIDYMVAESRLSGFNVPALVDSSLFAGKLSQKLKFKR
jgi:hypothetical protein